MKIGIKEAVIIDANSSHNKQSKDLIIENGTITKIGSGLNLDNCDTVIYKKELHLSAGWMDASVCFGEPGYEDRETLENGLNTAAKSGFTAVALQPNNNPIPDNQTHITYLKSKTANYLTDVYPVGAITMGSNGTDLAELFDMQKAGAIAFTDYKKHMHDANLQKIALQYLHNFNAPLISYSLDTHLKGKGMVHEGTESTKLGLKGIPPLAEAVAIARNIQILEYTGGKMHIPTLSCKESVDLIRIAKSKKINITCSVAIHNLIFTEEVLSNFDSNFKVLPPLRTEEDRKSLIAGVLDGTIDCITSDHNPIDIERKKLEFDLADYGTIGLESAFSALNTILPIHVIVDKLTAAKSIFNITNTSIEEGSLANLTLFTTTDEFEFNETHILSKSKNSAFLGKTLKGKVVATLNNNQIVIND